MPIVGCFLHWLAETARFPTPTSAHLRAHGTALLSLATESIGCIENYIPTSFWNAAISYWRCAALEANTCVLDVGGRCLERPVLTTTQHPALPRGIVVILPKNSFYDCSPDFSATFETRAFPDIRPLALVACNLHLPKRHTYIANPSLTDYPSQPHRRVTNLVCIDRRSHVRW